MSGGAFYRRLIDAGTMFIVAALSLLLLLYVGFAEGKRTYEEIELEKVTAQAIFVQNSIERFLRDGLPLKQYPGFATLVGPIVESQKEVDAMGLYDQSGRRLAIVVDKSNPKLPELSSAITRVKQKIEIEYGDTHYQVVVPLRTRFETVGAIVMMVRTEFIAEVLRASFLPLAFLAVGLAAAAAIVMSLAARYRPRSRDFWSNIAHGMAFLSMAAAVVCTLIVLYFDGVQGKIQTSIFTFSQRLHDIVAFDLDFKDFDGLNNVFEEFRRGNSEISQAALIVDSTVEVISTDHAKAHKAWVPVPSDYEFKADLSRPDGPRSVGVAVAVPRNVMVERVARSVKNFTALFIASAFLSGLFLQLHEALGGAKSPSSESPKAGPVGDSALLILKPIFFLAVFLDSMTYSFLPKFMQDAAVASGMSTSFAAMPFTAYYLTFAASLIPAGHVADRYGPNAVIVIGLILAGASVFGLAMPIGIVEMVALR